MVGDMRIKVGPVSVDTDGDPLPPGQIDAGRREVRIGTSTEPVRLGDVQPPGKKPMMAADWARGARLDAGLRAS